MAARSEPPRITPSLASPVDEATASRTAPGQVQGPLLSPLKKQQQSRLSSSEQPRDHDTGEQERLTALSDSGVLDARHYRLYADTARHAAHAFHTRYAQVSWIDADTVFAPGALLPATAIESGLPRGQSICTHLVSEQAPLIIDDLFADPRVDNLALVQHHGLRFYAGVPLRHAGQVIGSLCIVDDQPRSLSQADQALLERMAETLMQTIVADKA